MKNTILILLGAFLTLAIQALNNAPNYDDKTAAFKLCKNSEVFETCTLADLSHIASQIHETNEMSATERAQLIEILSN